jgi:hypothetical protein
MTLQLLNKEKFDFLFYQCNIKFSQLADVLNGDQSAIDMANCNV